MKISPIIIFLITHGAAYVMVTGIVFIVPVIFSVGAITFLEDKGSPMLIPAIALISLLTGIGLSAIFFVYTALFQFLAYKYKVSIIIPAILSPFVISLAILIFSFSSSVHNNYFFIIIGLCCFGLYLLYYGISLVGSVLLAKILRALVLFRLLLIANLRCLSRLVVVIK